MIPVTIIIGGQFGSEGKGAVMAYLLQNEGPSLAIRVGGPNAGHSMKYKGEVYKMRHIPCAWHNPRTILALGPGSLIDMDFLLNEEIPMVEKALGQSLAGRFFIDPAAIVITQAHKERESNLVSRIGSTGKGIGSARADHIMRIARPAEGYLPLKPYLAPVELMAREEAMADKRIFIESTQGFGLSLMRSGFYPYVTSRDITPAQALNDAGIPSQAPHRVIMVMRTFPIRVAGPSGPMSDETDWETLNRESGGYIQPEQTTVTLKTRRVGRWDPALAKRASMALHPDAVALTFFDYVRPDLANRSYLDADAFRRIAEYEKDCMAPVVWVSTGFQNLVLIDQNEGRTN